MSEELRLPEVNRAEIVGRIVHRPRLGKAQSGILRATFKVAVTRQDQGGEERAFVRCICVGETTEFARRVDRGDAVRIEGRLVQYEDNGGRRKIGIMVLGVQKLGGPKAEPLPESETRSGPEPETDVDLEPVMDPEPGPETDLDQEYETNRDPESVLPHHLRTRKGKLFWK